MAIDVTTFQYDLKHLTLAERQELAGMLPDPDTATASRLWKIVVGAFAIVLLASFAVLAFGMFRAPPNDAATKPELVLSMFTSAVGFLAGLFVPSPTSKT